MTTGISLALLSLPVVYTRTSIIKIYFSCTYKRSARQLKLTSNCVILLCHCTSTGFDFCHISKGSILFFWRDSPPPSPPPVNQGLLIRKVSRSHTTTRHSGRTPLVEWSARRRDLYLTTHNTHNRLTSIPLVSRRAAADLRLRPRGHWERPRFHHRTIIN